MTTTGDACVFPFTYYTSDTTSTTYTGCAPREVNDQHSEAWCATMVDSTGSHIFGESGDCVLRRDGGYCRREGRSGVLKIRDVSDLSPQDLRVWVFGQF